MQTTTKFCKDCRHILRGTSHKSEDYQLKFAHCAKTLKTDAGAYYVTGKVQDGDAVYCTTARISKMPDQCGPEGKFFEEAIPMAKGEA